MMFRISTLASFALVIGLVPVAATAQTVLVAAGPAARPAAVAAPPQSVPACSATNNALDERIAACTRYIDAGAGTRRELSLATVFRGSAYRGKGDLDHALADYNAAIRLDPTNTVALNFRGLAYRAKGDLDHAVADFSAAIRLNPAYTAAFTNRGLVYEDRNNLARARADFNAALARPPKYDTGADAQHTARERLAALAATPDRALKPAPNAAPNPAPNPAPMTVGAITPTAPEAASPAPPAAVVDVPRLVPQRPGAAAPPAAPTVATSPAGAAASGTRPASPPPPPAIADIPPLTPERAVAKPAPAATPAIVAATAPPSPVVAGRRIALVIGNSSYLTLHYIPNPLNDATDMANALKALGFTVSLGLDLRRAEMNDMLTRFAADARTAETALIFYSGHGVAHMNEQHRGENYLVPVDARVKDEADLRRLIKLDDVIAALQGASRNRILVLDASRDNEIGHQAAAYLPAARAAAFGRGLAKVAGADGALVVSAAQPDDVTADGKGRNSPFTEALLRRLRETPGVALKTLMKSVRADVIASSGGAQRPELTDSMAGDFVFKAGM